MSARGSSQPRRYSAVANDILGIAIGAVLGLSASFAPAVAVLGIAVLMVATRVGLARSRQRERFALLLRTSLGGGAVLAYVAMPTIQ